MHRLENVKKIKTSLVNHKCIKYACPGLDGEAPILEI